MVERGCSVRGSASKRPPNARAIAIATQPALRTEATSAASAHRRQRLAEVGQDVVDVLQPDREAHIALSDAGGALLLDAELRVRGAGGVDGEAARIADVSDMVEELQRVDEGAPRLAAAGQFEPDHAA